MKSATLYAIAAALTVGIVTLVLDQPLIGAGVVGLIGAVVLSARPKVLAALTVLATVFGPTLTRLSGFGMLDYVDDALIILLLASSVVHLLIEKRSMRWLPGTAWFAVFVLFAAMSAAASDAGFVLAATDAFLLLKGLIVAFSVAQINWKPEDLANAARVGAFIIVVILLGAAANFVMPDTWNTLFAQTDNLRERGGIPVLISFFGHPSLLAQMMAVAAIALFSYRQVVRKTPITLILLIATVVAAFATFRRKTAVGMVAALVALGFWKRPIPTTVVVLIAAPILIIVFRDSLMGVINEAYNEFFANSDGAARTVLYTGAFTLANQHFPLGVGFSQYGGFVAASNYSPFYVQLGFTGVWGLQPEGRFLTDTFWPAIIGEAGWIGAAAYLIGLVMLMVRGFRLARVGTDPHERWFGILALALSIEFAFESIASPVYVSPPSFLLLFGVLGVCASLNAQIDQQMSSPLPKQRGGRTETPIRVGAGSS